MSANKNIIHTKILAIFFVLMIVISFISTSQNYIVVNAVNESYYSNSNTQRHTKEEISRYINNHPVNTATKKYDLNPISSGGNYSLGQLDSNYLQDTLNALNICRYIAGLDEVSLDDEYIEIAQAGALLCAANNRLAHEQTKPSDMSESLYSLGSTGCGSSNLGLGHSSLPDAVFNGWMDDSDSSNYDRVGHRRWCLNPRMKKTGFGHVDSYTAMYAFDQDWSLSETEYTVVWPATTMPSFLFPIGSVWSVSKDREFTDNAKVTLTRKSDNKKWNFSKNSSDGIFYINNQGYGQTACIIFRPDSEINTYSDEIFNVNVEDSGYLLNYDVEFYCDHEETSTYVSNYQDADCVHSGSYDEITYCVVCGKQLDKKSITIPKKDHYSGFPVVENKIDPSCTQEGSYEEVTYCQICNKELNRIKYSIPKTGHSWGQWKKDGDSEKRICQNDSSHIETRSLRNEEQSNNSNQESKEQSNKNKESSSQRTNASKTESSSTSSIAQESSTVKNDISKITSESIELVSESESTVLEGENGIGDSSATSSNEEQILQPDNKFWNIVLIVTGVAIVSAVGIFFIIIIRHRHNKK